MAERRAAAVGAVEKLDLTPMIDIVFNLIVFFLLVAEMSNLEVEQLALARADQARELSAQDASDVMQVNVLADGRVRVRGRTWSVGPEARASEDPPLTLLLEAEAAGLPVEEDAASTLELTVRADRDAPFREVQEVLDVCQRARIYRTRFAADPAGR